MTDKEKLQKLFDAALREATPATGGSPKRAFPETSSPQPSAPVAAPAWKYSPPAASFEAELPDASVAARIQEPAAPEEAAVAAPEAPALDKAAADELGALMDEKIRKTARKRRRSALITAIVFFGATGGSVGWFVQSPARIEALTSAIREVRSVGDVKSIVAKFQAALDKIGARSQQIDQATAALGVTKTPEDEKDPYMEAEMKEMMGDDGKTVGERNRALQASFGDRAEEAGGAPKVSSVITKEDSFDFTN